MVQNYSKVIGDNTRRACRLGAASFCFLTCETLLAEPAKSTAIPRYSFNAKQGDFTIQGGLSMSNYTAVQGTIIGYRSKLSYYSDNQFGFFIGNDLPFTAGTIDIADVSYNVKLIPSKFGIFGAIPMSRRMSISVEGGAGSILVFGSGVPTASVPLLEAGVAVSYDSGVLRFFTEVNASQCKGTVQDNAVDLGRKTFVIGMGIKL